MPTSTVGYAAHDTSGNLTPWKFEHRDLRPNDVHIRVVACGICQTDVHFGRNDWGSTTYPCVPGHEITGYIEAIGSDVTKFKVGDKVCAGLIAESCQACAECLTDKEQYCQKAALICNGHLANDGGRSYGGYARDIVCQENYVCRYPENLDLYSGSPLLCAGITVYSAMKRFGMDVAGKRLGVIGLGGLGHMAVKFGVAFDLEVTVFSRSESKREEATVLLGAQHFLNTDDPQTFETAKNSLDFLIDTVAASKDVDSYLSLLRVDGTMVLLAIPEKQITVNGTSLLMSRKVLAGSVVGSVAEMEEMLQFCADKKVTPMIEIVSLDYVNTAWERMLKSDVHYRFVLDIQNSCPKV